MNLTEIFKNIFSKVNFEIEKFQKEKGINVTGKIDNSTFRRLETEKEYQKDMQNVIYCNNVPIPLANATVIQKRLPANCYRRQKMPRHPSMLVVHWDVALSVNSCFNILKARGISTHFAIDNPDPITGKAVIYQFVDANDVAYHSGPVSADKERLKKKGIIAGKWNDLSIGIDLSNGYYTKYNDWYLKNVKEKRPEITSICHGQKLNHLGYYPAQIEALKELITVLCDVYDIPLEYPKNDKDELALTVHKDAAEGKFNGVVNHYNLTYNKIDCSGLDLKSIIQGLKNDK